MTTTTSLGPIDRLPRPFRAAALEDYIRRREPVIVEGMFDGWPAYQRWDADYLAATYGDCRVRVRAVGADDVTDYSTKRVEEVPFGELVDAVRSSPARKRYYMTTANIYSPPTWMARLSGSRPVFPGMIDEIRIPAAVPRKALFEINLWVGFHGVVTGLHFDPTDNLLCAFRGAKDLRIFGRDQTEHLHLDSILDAKNPLESPVDPLAPDLTRHPRFAGAHCRTATLRRGDALYMPAGTWHHVRSDGFNVALNFWWRAAGWARDQLRTPLRRMPIWVAASLARKAVARVLPRADGASWSPR